MLLRKSNCCALLALVIGLSFLPGSLAQTTPSSADSVLVGGELNLYSARKEALIKPLLDEFSAQTGITVNLVTGKADALIQRMRAEGALSPVDVLITTDVGRLERAKQAGLTQPLATDLVSDVLTPRWYDEEGHWFALSKRVRAVMVRKTDRDEVAIDSIFDLKKPEFKGQICVRSSSNVYNQSMVAALLQRESRETVFSWARGMVENFARRPQGGDRDQIRGLVSGACRVAIANTYYLAGMLTDSQSNDAEIASQVSVIWPDQDGDGVHVNISGMAVAKHAKNLRQAEALLTFMLSEKAQDWYATNNHEYPVRAGIEVSEVLAEMGEFTGEALDLGAVGRANKASLILMESAGWR